MSQVSFYTGVPERLAYLCRLLRKAQQSGARIGVCGAPAQLDRLDAVLWSFEPTEFVPHLRLQPGRSPAPALAETPILLVEQGAQLPHREVLLNLGLELPEGFEQFERVLEVVSDDPEQVQAGRRRFKQYKELGHEVSHHVVGGA
ncbi:DNA polymerase III subunit chi [Roseateles violae]|uniref:DNA polymerase III subunit chi n=1 Tax=Roseateles violae TaxID=3058042 RepID=A0ABT8DVV8_9BURK|nr:DNA polymerase III subunit chi [Pelomonas sp. PFR6]MDN3920429.1 DNA polymerase III subunit chi [Pelomonas sp. PFR6]